MTITNLHYAIAKSLDATHETDLHKIFLTLRKIKEVLKAKFI